MSTGSRSVPLCESCLEREQNDHRVIEVRKYLCDDIAKDTGEVVQCGSIFLAALVCYEKHCYCGSKQEPRVVLCGVPVDEFESIDGLLVYLRVTACEKLGLNKPWWRDLLQVANFGCYCGDTGTAYRFDNASQIHKMNRDWLAMQHSNGLFD